MDEEKKRGKKRKKEIEVIRMEINWYTEKERHQ
jgi:hypothetical protein